MRKRGKGKRAPLSPNSPPFFPSSPSSFRRLLRRLLFRACLNGGGGPQVGELTLSAGVKSCYVHASRWGNQGNCGRIRVKSNLLLDRRTAFAGGFVPLLISDIIIHCTHSLSSHWLRAYS